MTHPVIITAAAHLSAILIFNAFLRARERRERYELKCRLRGKRKEAMHGRNRV